jgi:excisionase family DNA binding protein
MSLITPSDAKKVRENTAVCADLRLYTAAEVAELLRLNLQVVQRKLQAGEIPGYRIGREWRVDDEQLRAWLETRSNQRDPLANWFTSDGKLTRLPAQRAKRELVLRRIADAIEPRRVYREAELNSLLRRFHEDVAAIRRELVATKYLVRSKDGVYKRTGPRDAAIPNAG